jgi:hypothetical protein
VLASHDGALIVGAGEGDLARIKVKPGDALALRLPSGERTVHYAIDRRAKDQLLESLQPPSDRARVEALEKRKAELLESIEDLRQAAAIGKAVAKLDEEIAALRVPLERTAPLQARAWHH